VSRLQLLLLTIVGWGIGSLFYKPACDRMDPVWVSATGIVVYLILLPAQIVALRPPQTWSLVGIGYSGLAAICMCVGSLAHFYLLQKGGAGEMTAVTSVYPLVTVALSLVFFGERLDWNKTIAVALAFGSVYFFSRPT